MTGSEQQMVVQLLDELKFRLPGSIVKEGFVKTRLTSVANQFALPLGRCSRAKSCLVSVLNSTIHPAWRLVSAAAAAAAYARTSRGLHMKRCQIRTAVPERSYKFKLLFL